MTYRVKELLSVFLVVILGLTSLCTAQPEPPDGPVPEGIPPGDMPPEGMPSGEMGSGQPSSYTLAGIYTVDGETKSSDNEVFTSNETDMSAILVTNKGSLTLFNPTIITHGNTSSNDASSFYGLNGAVLVNNGSSVSIIGGSITTTGSGANGVIPTGEGTSVTLSDMNITASGGGGHGVMATLGASLTLNNVNIATTGKNSAPIATDRGSGTVTVTGGTITSSGTDSPGIYSTGIISVSDAKITSTGTEAAVIEGVNSIVLQNATLTGGVAKTGGVMIYQSFSGDADIGTGTFSMNGGSLTIPEGPVFFVTNTDAIINMSNVTLSADSDELVKAAATSRWGTEGSNGGNVALTADNQVLSGSIVADEISTILVTLTNNSVLSGTITNAGLILDDSSSWNVTGNSTLLGLVSFELSGDTITNVIGNGYTVTYDAGLQENSPLGGKTYPLKEGGELTPK